MNKSSKKDKSGNAEELIDSNNQENNFFVKILYKDDDNEKFLVEGDTNLIMSFISKERASLNLAETNKVWYAFG